MNPKSSTFLLNPQCYWETGEDVWICIYFQTALKWRQGRLKPHQDLLAFIFQTGVSHVLSVCFYFNALSIGCSGTTMELFCSQTEALVLLFDGLNQKHSFFVLFVVSAILKGRLSSCAIPFSHVCMFEHTMCVCMYAVHCSNAIVISFPCSPQRKPKQTSPP